MATSVKRIQVPICLHHIAGKEPSKQLEVSNSVHLVWNMVWTVSIVINHGGVIKMAVDRDKIIYEKQNYSIETDRDLSILDYFAVYVFVSPAIDLKPSFFLPPSSTMSLVCDLSTL
ncbi:hypothetical protein OPV22_023086 [Ensete ventricosum]|uniref:Uncharacterized protein n=1 Tax=Ensete ventricosum TaxID=4639 RepID=A0AAV8QH38_ENSVE|nr:hypothetical protein OPV22_023086 [Ensete ventricosum]